MVTINVTTNFPAVKAWLDRSQKQASYALAVALTKTAQQVRDELKVEMRRVFDRPTPYTLNSLYLKPATKTRLEAEVGVKGSDRPKHYLLPEIGGGARPQKRFEELLQQAGIMSASERAVPGSGAKLDAFGNMGRGQIVQILSQLRAFNLSGFDANATNSRRSRAKRARVKYFVARKGESRVGGGAWRGGDKVQHLPSGIYAKTAKGRIVPVLVFVKGAQYKARFQFFKVANRVVDARFADNFASAYRAAIATSR